MRVVFFGTPALAVPSLTALAARHEVAAVVCQPDRPQGRSGALVPPPAKVRAIELGLPVVQPEKLNDGTFEAWLKSVKPDVCAVAAYGRMLKQPLLDVPPLGYLNVHPSLLPRHRGPSPIQTALLEGDEVTGVSIIRLVLEMDAGDILLQERLPIEPSENAEELSARLADLGAELIVRAVEQAATGQAVYTPQDPAGVTHSRMLEKRDGYIDWGRSARALHNLVRATYPWPSAQCLYAGEVCRIHRSEVVAQFSTEAPGTITAVEKDRVIVACGEGQLAILHFQAPGKKAMPMGDFLRGRRMHCGERLEAIPE